jgi:hypothetical protein
VRHVVTDKDPKAYSLDEIKEILKWLVGFEDLLANTSGKSSRRIVWWPKVM